MRNDFEAYIQRVLDDIKKQDGGCEHLEAIRPVSPSSANACQECVKMGDAWVSLRICLICGNVSCCDSSINQHARKHYHSSNHGLILSYEPRELWMYCFADDMIFVAPE
jgi:uncharacterized UBP type Zn finger protein